MWREVIAGIFSDAAFYEPVLSDEITDAGKTIELPFPPDLEKLYAETDGVYLSDASMWIIWPIDTLVKENQYMRSAEVAFYEMSFANLFFFGDLGNGDHFAFRYDAEAASYTSAGRWDHEDGEYREDGTSLKDCLNSFA